MDWPLPQESVDVSFMSTNVYPPTPQSSAIGQDRVEVDELPITWDDLGIGPGQLPSLHPPNSRLALMRQRRREHHRRRGHSCPEHRQHRQRRAACRPNQTSAAANQPLHAHPSKPSRQGAEPAAHPEHQHQHPHVEWPRPQSSRTSPPPSDSIRNPESDHVVSSGMPCDSAAGTDGDVGMSLPDDQPSTSHDAPSLKSHSDAAQLSKPDIYIRPPPRPSTLRTEAIRAALALEALTIGNESSDQAEAYEYDATSPVSPLDPSSGQELPVGLALHKEYGLLRVRTASTAAAAAAATGDRVLVHSVPRVRRRRLKKLETQPKSGDDAPAPEVMEVSQTP